MATLICATCAEPFKRAGGQVNRGIRVRAVAAFCSQKCFGISRRKWKPVKQKKREKKAYDERYREQNRKRLAKQKAAHFQRTYDPEKARKERRGRMAEHVAYCRRYYADPKRKAGKVAYDLDRRADKFGEYAEPYKLLRLLEQEVRARLPDKYERAKARGYYERNAQQRRRDAQISRW